MLSTFFATGKTKFFRVVALMEMLSSSIPITLASVCCMAGIWDFSLGRSTDGCINVAHGIAFGCNLFYGFLQ